MTEFNLSEKIKTKHEFNYQHQGFHSDPELLEVTDVKEFIRNIREELKNPKLNRFGVDEIIDYYAGDKLK